MNRLLMAVWLVACGGSAQDDPTVDSDTDTRADTDTPTDLPTPTGGGGPTPPTGDTYDTATLGSTGDTGSTSGSTTLLASDLVGTAWVLDSWQAASIEPTTLEVSEGEAELLLQVTAAVGQNMSVRLSHTVDGGVEQEMCSPTLDIPQVQLVDNGFTARSDWSLGNPEFDPIDLQGFVVEVDLDDMSSGMASFSYTVDTFQLDAQGGYSQGWTCDSLAADGVDCEPCPTSGVSSCLTTSFTGVPVTTVSGGVVSRTPGQVVTDPGCAEDTGA